mgnify:CR=1 FL=1
MLDVATWACLIGGSVFALIGVVGIIRFPDVYSRMHASSLVETLGMGLILLGLAFQAGLSLISVKLALIFIFLFFTNPTTTHALARALVYAGIKPYVVTKKDDAP